MARRAPERRPELRPASNDMHCGGLPARLGGVKGGVRFLDSARAMAFDANMRTTTSTPNRRRSAPAPTVMARARGTTTRKVTDATAPRPVVRAVRPSAPTAATSRSQGAAVVRAPASVRTAAVVAGLTIGGGALAAAPLGLASLPQADALAAELQLRAGGSEVVLSPWLVWLASWLPGGDLAFRSAVIAALLAGVCAALLVPLLWWGVSAALARADATGKPLAAAHPLHPELLIAVVGAAAVVLSAPPVAPLLLRAAPVGVTAVVALLGAWLSLLVARRPVAQVPGLALGALTGVACAGVPTAAVLLVPSFVGVVARAVHARARWCLLAAAAFAAGCTLAVLPVLRPAVAAPAWYRPWWLALHAALKAVPTPAAARVLVALADDVGVVGSLLALSGLLTLLSRRRAVLLAWVAAAALSAGLATHTDQDGSARALFVLLWAWPLAVGLGALAQRLGRARAPAALVLAIIAFTQPAFTGGTARWRDATRVAPRLIARALASAPPRASVSGGSRTMDGLLRYGAATGARPDVTLLPTR